MKIVVKIKAGSKRPFIDETNKHYLEIGVKALPKKGLANKDVIKALSLYYGISKNKITIIKGKSSRIKVIEIENE